MMKHLMLVLIVLMVLLAACDHRDTDKPELMVTSSTLELYNELNSLKTADIVIDLDGDKASTIDMRVNIEYDSDMATFSPDHGYEGSASYVKTDSLGIAMGTFTAKDSVTGALPVTFMVDLYQSVSTTLHFTVLDVPDIQIEASQDYIPADGVTWTEVTVQLSSETDNIEGYWIDFESDLTLEYSSLQTDSTGSVVNRVLAPNTSGDYMFDATLNMFDKGNSIFLHYTN